MVTGWRKAFCTSIPKDPDSSINNGRSPKLSSKFNLFSSSASSSTPPTQPPSPTILRSRATATPPNQPQSTTTTPKLRCKTTPATTPKSKPTPRSPSTFSLLLKTSLGLTTNNLSRCGICSHSVKSGNGTAIFTGECSHSFHFPCISSLASKSTGLLHTCPFCGSHWKQSPVFPTPKSPTVQKDVTLRLYNDDEPLMSPVSGIRFNPILESEEEDAISDTDTDVEFPGFFSDPVTPRPQPRKGIEVKISTEAAVVAVGRTYETYAMLLTIKAPAGIRRASIDLVAVVDIGGDMSPEKLHVMKRAMRTLISSLSSNDRLSIVAFSSSSKRLLPLRRMTPSGKRYARRTIETLNLGQGSCTNDALKKAAKVLQDRKEKNHFTSIILLDSQADDLNRRFEHKSSTHLLEIPVHTFRIGEELNEEIFVKSVNCCLSIVVLDLRIQLGLGSGSSPAEIAAVYTCTGRPMLLNANLAKLGSLYSEENREILVELKVPATSIGSNHFLSVRSFHKEPLTKQLIYSGDQSVTVPRPHTIRSSDPCIQRLRSMFVMTRAVAESRRMLSEKNDCTSAERLLLSAKAVLDQPRLKIPAVDDFRRRLEAELAEVRWQKRRREKDGAGKVAGYVGGGVGEEKGEVLTPTSAWKAAERLAKVAIMRKSLNRVSDLHGFEDARF